MQYDENFCRDCPVVKIRNVPLKNKLECTDRAHLVLVLTIKTFQKIY